MKHRYESLPSSSILHGMANRENVQTGSIANEQRQADCRLLRVLDENCGYLARQVAEMTIGGGRSNTLKMSRDLRQLEARGLVDRLDHETPICWRRTPAGTRLLDGCTNNGSSEFEQWEPFRPPSAGHCVLHGIMEIRHWA
jgi:hypothetical protein